MGVTATRVESSRGVNPPVMGERARAACRVPVGGEKRRRLLVLLGAVADANEGRCCPSTELMLERLPAITSAGKLYGILRRLADDGLVRALPRGGGWELLFLDDAAGGE
jgi:hypothetical protein